MNEQQAERITIAVETLCSQFAMLLQVLMQDPDASDVEQTKPTRTLDEPLTPRQLAELAAKYGGGYVPAPVDAISTKPIRPDAD